jgi:hypothetical protein
LKATPFVISLLDRVIEGSEQLYNLADSGAEKLSDWTGSTDPSQRAAEQIKANLAEHVKNISGASLLGSSTPAIHIGEIHQAIGDLLAARGSLDVGLNAVAHGYQRTNGSVETFHGIQPELASNLQNELDDKASIVSKFFDRINADYSAGHPVSAARIDAANEGMRDLIAKEKEAQVFLSHIQSYFQPTSISAGDQEGDAFFGSAVTSSSHDMQDAIARINVTALNLPRTLADTSKNVHDVNSHLDSTNTLLGTFGTNLMSANDALSQVTSSSNSGSGTGAGGTSLTQNNSFQVGAIDVGQASSQIAAKLLPYLRQAAKAAQSDLALAGARALIASGL